MPKKQNKHRKNQQMTKRRLEEKRHRLRFYWATLAGVSFAVFFFNFALTISGGWDDVSSFAILISSILALFSLAVASISVLKYRAQNYEIVTPLAILGVSALFYFAVTLIGATSIMAGI